MIVYNIVLKLLKKLDPKWIPAIILGITVLGGVIYLIYTKKRAEALNKKLKKKLALAESAALEARVEEVEEVAKVHIKRAEKLEVEAEKIKEEIKEINTSAVKSREKVLKATSWEDLEL